jgi:Zn finger protein HypA/HybF involved in hydrogenase expression
MVLTKYDPFTTGKTSSIDTADRCDRILAGNTANSAAMVKLQPKAGPAAQALGPMLRFHLDRYLKGIVKRPFPTTLMEEFAKDLCECRKCSFLSHASAVICPSCGNIL